MDVQFRPFQPDDKPALERMVFSLYGSMTGEPMSTEKINATIRKFTAEPNRGSIFIFEKQNLIVGYAIVVFFWSNEYGGDILIIDELFVAEGFRSHGVGSAFFAFLKKKYHHTAVAWELEVTKKNTRAQQFYQRLGFQKHKNIILFKHLRPGHG